MCIAVAGEHVEYDDVEQTDDFCRGHISPRYIEHVLQGRPASSGLVGLILSGWRLTQSLAVILLVQPATTTADIRAVVSLHEQIGPLASCAGCYFRRRNSHTFCQRQAECLVLNAARQTRRVRLENVC